MTNGIEFHYVVCGIYGRGKEGLSAKIDKHETVGGFEHKVCLFFPPYVKFMISAGF